MVNIYKETINNEIIKWWWWVFNIVDIQTSKRKWQINLFYNWIFWEGYREIKYYSYKSYFKIMIEIYKSIKVHSNLWFNFNREIHRKRVKRYH